MSGSIYSKSTEDSNWIVMAKLGKSWSTKGAIRIHSYSDWQTITKIKKWKFQNSQTSFFLNVEAFFTKNKTIKFTEINTRELAKNLQNGQLLAQKKELPKLTCDEYYHFQLIGKQVINFNNQILGSVRAIDNNGVQDILVIKANKNSKPKLIPLVKEFVGKIDQDKIIVDWQLDWD